MRGSYVEIEARSAKLEGTRSNAIGRVHLRTDSPLQFHRISR